MFLRSVGCGRDECDLSIDKMEDFFISLLCVHSICDCALFLINLFIVFCFFNLRQQNTHFIFQSMKEEYIWIMEDMSATN